MNTVMRNAPVNTSSVDLPFWVITECPDVLNPPPNEPCEVPRAAYAFTLAEKLVAFMKPRVGATWHIAQVADREGVIVAVATLHARGVPTLCIDPVPNGLGGLLVSLSDLLAAYDR